MSTSAHTVWLEKLRRNKAFGLPFLVHLNAFVMTLLLRLLGDYLNVALLMLVLYNVVRMAMVQWRPEWGFSTAYLVFIDEPVFPTSLPNFRWRAFIFCAAGYMCLVCKREGHLFSCESFESVMLYLLSLVFHFGAFSMCAE